MNPLRLKRSGQPEPLSETAASWVLRAETGLSAEDEKQLRKWLSEPAHAKAYEDAVWGLDALQRNAASPELMQMREAALAKRGDRGKRMGWLAGLGTAAAAAAALLVWSGPPARNAVGGAPPETIASATSNPASSQRGVYRTGIGERSAVVLPDGSVATLDTDSILRVAYSDTERGVYLVRGQALFEVAHGKPIPFQVYANGQRITAVGTTFNVRLRGDKLQVSMVEGVVTVTRLDQAAGSAGAPKPQLTLRTGESVTVSPSEPATVESVDTHQVATWRGGLLVFQDEKLSDAVAEINRYTDKPIRIADASIGSYHVTGVFQTNDPGHFAEAMSEVFPLKVEHDRAGAPVLAADR